MKDITIKLNKEDAKTIEKILTYLDIDDIKEIIDRYLLTIDDSLAYDAFTNLLIEIMNATLK